MLRAALSSSRGYSYTRGCASLSFCFKRSFPRARCCGSYTGATESARCTGGWASLSSSLTCPRRSPLASHYSYIALAAMRPGSRWPRTLHRGRRAINQRTTLCTVAEEDEVALSDDPCIICFGAFAQGDSIRRLAHCRIDLCAGSSKIWP